MPFFAPEGTVGTDDPASGHTSQTSTSGDDPRQSDGTDDTIPTHLPDGELMKDIVPAAYTGNLEAVDPELASTVLCYADQLLLKLLENVVMSWFRQLLFFWLWL